MCRHVASSQIMRPSSVPSSRIGLTPAGCAGRSTVATSPISCDSRMVRGEWTASWASRTRRASRRALLRFVDDRKSVPIAEGRRGSSTDVIFPPLIRTPRLALRRWHPDDATALQPILEVNTAHLGPWIPAHVANPGSLLELVDRLERFAIAFDDQREWRYAIFGLQHGQLLGEVSLFPRSPAGRVA